MAGQIWGLLHIAIKSYFTHHLAIIYKGRYYQRSFSFAHFYFPPGTAVINQRGGNSKNWPKIEWKCGGRRKGCRVQTYSPRLGIYVVKRPSLMPLLLNSFSVKKLNFCINLVETCSSEITYHIVIGSVEGSRLAGLHEMNNVLCKVFKTKWNKWC